MLNIIVKFVDIVKIIVWCHQRSYNGIDYFLLLIAHGIENVADGFASFGMLQLVVVDRFLFGIINRVVIITSLGFFVRAVFRMFQQKMLARINNGFVIYRFERSVTMAKA